MAEQTVTLKGMGKLTKTMKGLQAAVGAKYHKDVIMPSLGNDAIELIQTRTEKGNSASGAKFKKYSEGWAKIREKNQRQTGHVDLNMTSNMMNSMTHTVKTSYSVIIHFISKLGQSLAKLPEGYGKRSPAEKAFYTHKRFDWFRLSQRNNRLLFKRYRQLLKKKSGL